LIARTAFVNQLPDEPRFVSRPPGRFENFAVGAADGEACETPDRPL
jgi:hypothetical protein